ncbi:hypothetical protein LTR08_004227 [Meristemomyces frigidus]|nr:hypothetical protein LTR08_004227 [Meristemomyces frigidus]
MAHELGHAMGLYHEHQRPDFHTFLEWSPNYLVGWKEAQAAVSGSTLFDPSWSVAQRMSKVLTNSAYAREFFPIVMNYLSGKYLASSEQQTVPPSTAPFDFGSIMIYSSETLIHVDDWKETFADAKFPIMKKEADGSPSTYPGSVIYAGGTGGDDSKARISAYDIKRVAALYPGRPDQQAAAARLGGARGAEQVNWEPAVYGIPNLVSGQNLWPNPFDLGWADADGELVEITQSLQPAVPLDESRLMGLADAAALQQYVE